MLTIEQIENNKEKFLSLLRGIENEKIVPGIDRLISKLECSDFFYAPASTKYEYAFPGGLCLHSLNVLSVLMHLTKDILCPYTKESIILVALLHDIRKMNYYEETVINKKVYSEQGTKQDALGLFDWVSEKSYRVRDDKFVYGTDGQTSEFMIRQFIPLTVEESVALINCKGGKDNDSAKGDNLMEIYKKYPLAALLHASDLVATVYNTDEDHYSMESVE